MWTSRGICVLVHFGGVHGLAFLSIMAQCVAACPAWLQVMTTLPNCLMCAS